MRIIFLALIIIPAIEIGIFVWVGGMIGPWWVVSLIVLSGILGVALAKKEGAQTWIKARKSTKKGQMPAAEIIDGICIFIGAVLLFSPGFLTDIVGLLLVIPYTRYFLKLGIVKWIQSKVSKGAIIYRK